MELDKFLKFLKEIVTHIIALSMIIPLSFLMYKSATNPEIEIPTLLVSIVSIIIGFYFGRYIRDL